jgi:hypothetical protein
MLSRGRLTNWDGAAGALPQSYPPRRINERQRQKNSFERIHERRMIIQYNIGPTLEIL